VSGSPSLFVRARNQVRAALGLGRIRSFEIFERAVRGRAGLEIGGPSQLFTRVGRLPVYDRVGSLDNCVFASSTVWAEQAQAYSFSRRRPPGRCVVQEATALTAIPDRSYEFVLSSHALEHVANPVGALREWARVLRPGGALVLVLPDHRNTFDHRRRPTPVEHMLQDAAAGVGEDDLTHLPEILELHDLSRDPEAGSLEQFRARSLANAANRCLHHHVFDERNSRELLQATGFSVRAVELARPFHIFLLAFAPER
jgi:SAM-dependent methyltransferase